MDPTRSIQVLTDLTRLCVEHPAGFRVVKNGRTYSIETISWIKALFFRLLSCFCIDLRQSPKDLKELKSFFVELAQVIKQNPEVKESYRRPIEKAFEALKKLYIYYDGDVSVSSSLKRNDILEALSTAYSPQNSFNELLDLRIERIKLSSLRSRTVPFSENHIPLVRFADLSRALPLLQHPEPTLKYVHSQLGNLLSQEVVPMGWAIEFIYSNHLNYRVVNSAATHYLGHRHNQPRSTESIVKFLNSLAILQEVEYNGELYAYSEFFKKSLRDERTNNEAFTREISDFARNLLFKRSEKLQKDVLNVCGGTVIVSNSDNRLRLIKVLPGSVGKTFNIVGKLLNHESENLDKARYARAYTGKYAFHIKNLFGSGNDRVTTFPRVLGEESPTRLLLDCVINLLNRKAFFMVIQRLAPQNIHQFVATVEGQILSKADGCKALLELLPPEETVELKVLTGLQNLFAAQPKEVQANPIVGIHGNQDSVNTKAVLNVSAILAENDRQIFLQRDKNGLSIHICIGAMGVNNVQVPLESEQNLLLGDKVGIMAFGNNVDKTHWEKTAKAGAVTKIGDSLGTFEIGGSTVVSIYLEENFVPMPELELFSQVGKYKTYRSLGFFERIYNCFVKVIGKCFGLKPYRRNKIINEIEVETKMGEVIGLPRVYVAIKAIEEVVTRQELSKIFEDAKQAKETAEEIVDRMLNKFHADYRPMVSPTFTKDIVIKQLWEAIGKHSQHQPLTQEERSLLNKVKAALKSYTV